MLESAVTPEVFRRGIQQYLRQHAWGTATAEDLMQGAGTRSPGDAQTTKIAESYIQQPGIPLIKLDWQCHDGELAIDIEQQQRLPVGSRRQPRSGMDSANLPHTAQRRPPGIGAMYWTGASGATLPRATMSWRCHAKLQWPGYYRFTLPRHKCWRTRPHRRVKPR